MGGELGNRPDRVVGSHPNPVGDWPVLTHLLRQLFLNYKGLVGRLRMYTYIFIQTHIKNSFIFQQNSLTNEREREREYHLRCWRSPLQMLREGGSERKPW
jgi:hypothetical protein